MKIFIISIILFANAVFSQGIYETIEKTGMTKKTIKYKHTVSIPDSFYAINHFIYIDSLKKWLLVDGFSCQFWINGKTFVKKGNGPGEFNLILSVAYNKEDDSIIVLTNRKITVLNTNLIYQKHFIFKQKIDGNILVKNNFLYFTNFVPKRRIYKSTISGKILSSFESINELDFTQIKSFLQWEYDVSSTGEVYIVFSSNMDVLKLSEMLLPLNSFESPIKIENYKLSKIPDSPFDIKALSDSYKKAVKAKIVLDVAVNSKNYTLYILLKNENNQQCIISFNTVNMIPEYYYELPKSKTYSKIKIVNNLVFLLTAQNDAIDIFEIL